MLAKVDDCRRKSLDVSWIALLISAAWIALTPPVLLANGSLAGNITDSETSAALAGVAVRVYSAGSLVGSANSDSSGDYFISLPEGSYDLTVTASFHQDTTGSVAITEGAASTRDFSLISFKVSGLAGTLGTPNDPQCALVQECVDNGGRLKVELYRNSSLYRTAFVDLDGNYAFTSIATGTYSVKLTQPDNLTRTSADLTVDDSTPQQSYSADLDAIVTRLDVDLDVIVGASTYRVVEDGVIQAGAANQVSIQQEKDFTLSMTVSNSGNVALSGTSFVRPAFKTDPDESVLTEIQLRQGFTELAPSGQPGSSFVVSKDYRNLKGALDQMAGINFENRFWYVPDSTLSTSPYRPSTWSTEPYRTFDDGALWVNIPAILGEIVTLRTDLTGYIRGEVANVTTEMTNQTATRLDRVALDWFLHSLRPGAEVHQHLDSQEIALAPGSLVLTPVVGPLVSIERPPSTPATTRLPASLPI